MPRLSFEVFNYFAWLRNLAALNVGILENQGAPTSGTSGTAAKFAGPGCLLIDTTNKNIYINTNTKASPTWSQIDNAGTLFPELPQDNVTAGTTQTQAGATALTGQLVRVATVANVGDGVKLPASVAGLSITIVNNGANPMKVYGLGADTINSITNTTGIFQGAGSVAIYCCTVAGNWLVSFESLYGSTPVAITGDGAINPRASQLYVITKGSAAALTIAAPTAVIDDGVQITITSDTAFAHVLTFTGSILDSGSALVATLTWNPNKGASAELLCYNARVKLLSGNGVSAA